MSYPNGIPFGQKGAANGVASLDSGGKVPAAQMPAGFVGTAVVASEAAMLALADNPGQRAIRTDLTPDQIYTQTTSPASTLANWQITTADVASEVTFVPDGPTTSTNVQAAILEVRDDAVILIAQSKDSLSWKPPAKVATTNELTLSGEQTISGVACVAGDIVLALGQDNGDFTSPHVDNGWWTVQAGAWVRPSWFGLFTQYGAVGNVRSGTNGFARATFQLFQEGVVTVGTTPISFTFLVEGPAMSMSDMVGFNLTWLSVDEVEVTAGRVRDYDNGYDIETSGTLSADITASGAGGLDTGAVAANTVYFLHVIRSLTDTGTYPDAVMFSLSQTAPTLPTEYHAFRAITFVTTNSVPAIRNIRQAPGGGNRFYNYQVQSSTNNVLSGGAAETPTAVSLAGLIPPGTRQVYLGLFASVARLQILDDITGANVMVQLTPSTARWMDVFQCDSNRDVFYSNDAALGSSTIRVRGFWWQI